MWLIKEIMCQENSATSYNAEKTTQYNWGKQLYTQIIIIKGSEHY